jgi:general secretion pathway protein I
MLHQRQRGMTLLEVLVAFVVLSLTLSVIMQIFSGGIRNAHMADGYSRAVFLAESKLASVGADVPLTIGETSGQASSDMRWRVQVTPAEDAARADRMQMRALLLNVVVEVEWAEDGKARRIALATMRLGAKP